DRGITKRKSSELIKEEISFQKLKDFINQISYFRPNITLFGGEPLIYPNCIELIKYIKQKRLHCLLITNGSLLEENADDLFSAGLDELNVSLDGDKKIHDEVRGMPGLFEKIERGLKRIYALKKENKTKKPLVNLQTTITKYNYIYLERLVDVAFAVGADSLTFHNLIFISSDALSEQENIDRILKASSEDWQGFLFSPDIDVELLYKKIKKIIAKKYTFSVDFYPNFSYKELKQYYLNPKYRPQQYFARCLSPWITAYIFPDGEVRPCLNSTYSFGNIKEDKFLRIWNSKRAVEFRRLLKKIKIFPVCVRCTELFRY
ncbi:MAG: radical SAM protein, partial [Candidatus Omnitrophica bacterium]|nr:radical SAM protein [Candidatus Omnitrophota bacterium]